MNRAQQLRRYCVHCVQPCTLTRGADMQAVNRTLVNPPVSSRDAFAALDARRELEHDEAIADASHPHESIVNGAWKESAAILREHARKALELAERLDPQPNAGEPTIDIGLRVRNSRGTVVVERTGCVGKVGDGVFNIPLDGLTGTLTVSIERTR